jgi:hypothetical protein
MRSANFLSAGFILFLVPGILLVLSGSFLFAAAPAAILDATLQDPARLLQMSPTSLQAVLLVAGILMNLAALFSFVVKLLMSAGAIFGQPGRRSRKRKDDSEENWIFI